jgi:hypothetical protein
MRKFNIVYLPLILLLLFISPVFPKEDTPENTEQLRDDIQVINLLNNLSLRPNQMEFILQKAKEVSQIRRSATEKATFYKSEIADTYSAIKEEVEEGRVIVDQPNAQKFRRLKEEEERITREAYAQIDKIVPGVESSLEEFQLLALDGYKACIIPIVKNNRIGQAGTNQGIVRILEKVRGIPGEKFWSERGSLARTIIEKTKLKLPPGAKFDEAKAQDCIFRVFDEARKIEEVDFGLRKEALAEELESGILPATPGMERSNKIKKFLLSDSIIPILEKKISESKAGQ